MWPSSRELLIRTVSLLVIAFLLSTFLSVSPAPAQDSEVFLSLPDRL